MALSFAVPSFIPVRQKQLRVIPCRFCIFANLQSAGFERRSGHYQPTIWNDNSIQSLNYGNEHEGKNMERVCKIKKEVSQMIYKEELLRDKLELVDALQQLGVAYHFKDEINCVLTSIHESMGSAMPDDLYEVSLLFRLLRMHGFSVQEGFERRSGHYQSTIWNDNFIQSLNCGNEHEGKNMERVCKLKKEVSQMIYKEELLRDKLELVDVLQQLGVTYHFKDEINCVLTNIHESMASAMPDDLYEVSLLFRLLRMHGFSVQEVIFKSYFDGKGNCKAKQYSDIKEMISLYEASFLAKEEEKALEVARHFTTKHLTSSLESTIVDNSRLKEHVAHALELPLNWRMQRIHTRWFIEQYKIDEQIRPVLCELAVLDFNLIQNLYKKELKQVSRWWADLGLYEKLPFIRDRLVENYIGIVGFAFEPEHSSYRIATTQAACLITTLDDIYDVYGSLDELEVFTNAIQQWDITASKGLPENFRMCILALFKTVEDQGNQILKEKGLYVIPHLRQAWKDLCQSYIVEARRYHNGYAPTLQEYLENAWVSISGHIVLSYAYCINDYVTAKDLEQFSSGYPDIVRYSSMIFRLHNDLATSTDEMGRGDTDKSIQCYMRDKGVTESVARQEIKELISKYWTMLHGEVVGHSSFEKCINNVALNVSRMAQRIFQLGDGYGKPDSDTKDLVTAILLEPVN